MSSMKGVFMPLLFAFLYLVSAVLALHFTQGQDGIAAIWPASGFLVAGLLLFGKRRHPFFVSAVALASMAANLYAGVPPLIAAAYSAANLIEGYIVFALMGSKSRRPQLSDPLTLLRFGVSATVAGLVSALLAGILSVNFSLEFLSSWASTVTLGMLLVTPLIFFLFENPEGCPSLLSFKGLWTLVFVVLASVAGFAQANVPLMFIPVVAVSIATYLLGLRGAGLAILIIAAIGSFLTALNQGPLPIFFSATTDQVVYFQVYLVALLISALPLAAVLEQRERNLAELRISNSLLKSAESAAHVGHWHYRVADRSTIWSEEARRIFQIDQMEPVSLFDALQNFAPDDQERVRNFMMQAVANGTPFSFEARIPSRDGRMAHVECRGKVELGDDRKVVSVLGTVIDVSDRAQAVWLATKSRERAERETAKARELAETDPLTGLPNRRKIMDLLRLSLDHCDAKRPVSVAMIDIDHFKSINDTLGHEEGDRVLHHIARLLAGLKRNGDHVGRLGGEEFLVILPDTTLQSAAKLIDEWREAVASQSLGKQSLSPVTFSAGISSSEMPGDTRQILRDADKALYEAKNGGRNRVSSASVGYT